jgi:acyl-CoA thioester hydrolase
MERLRYELQIYPFQIDAMRHLSNIVYIPWMEIGRCLLLEAVEMPISEITERGFGPVLVETVINYKKPLRLSGQVHADIWLSELSQAWRAHR